MISAAHVPLRHARLAFSRSPEAKTFASVKRAPRARASAFWSTGADGPRKKILRAFFASRFLREGRGDQRDLPTLPGGLLEMLNQLLYFLRF